MEPKIHLFLTFFEVLSSHCVDCKIDESKAVTTTIAKIGTTEL
jgi:hypothetical protein